MPPGAKIPDNHPPFFASAHAEALSRLQFGYRQIWGILGLNHAVQQRIAGVRHPGFAKFLPCARALWISG